MKAALNVRQYSDLFFRQRYQDDFNAATSRTQRWSGSIEKDLKLAVLSAYADTTSTYFGTDYTHVNGRLPGLSLRRFPRQIGWGKVGGGPRRDRRAAPVRRRGATSTTGRASTSHPYVSRPFSLSFLEFTPVGALPLHALRLELRHDARRERRRRDPDHRPADRPPVLRDAGRDARADLREGLGHAGLRLLRALQARDRARGGLDLQDARRRLQRDPEVRRQRLLPRHQPDRLLARAALLREAPRPVGQAASPSSS